MTLSAPAQSLSDLIEGFWTTQLIGAAVGIGIPDTLEGGSLSCQEIAGSCQSDPGCTLRLLRALQAIGLCRTDSSMRFELTQKGRMLCSGAPGSMRGRALFTSGMMWELFGDLQSVVRTGQPTRRVALGRDGFNQLAGKPGLSGMHQAMVESSINVMSAAMDVFDFARYTRALDVGGGYGGALAALLQRHSHMRGDVLDLAYLERESGAYLQAAGVAGRARFIGGDFFELIPAGYDCYLLKYIIHDWDDVHASLILKTVASAAGRGGEVILLERVLPAQLDETHRSIAQIDLAMMITGGRERTVEEFAALLQSAGMRMLAATPTISGCSLIRAAPAG
jgi:hypothetical protein